MPQCIGYSRQNNIVFNLLKDIHHLFKPIKDEKLLPTGKN
ncbi:MAG: hypothetical protein JWQ14_989 [Adhaeribacter sp.]|nr:hypothetical protein [Adhaeribacter sp.]